MAPRAIPEARPRLTLRRLYLLAFRTYRDHFLRVAVPAVVVFVPVSIIETVVEYYGERYHERQQSSIGVLVEIVSIVLTTVSAFGLVFYAGLLDALVGAARFGHAERRVGAVLRELPYVRLLVADSIVLLVSYAGYALLIVPGIVAFTLLGIVGPVINIEGHGAFAALRRSAGLMRPHLLLGLCAVTLPLTIEQGLNSGLGVAVWERGFLPGFGMNAGLAVVVGATAGLLEVTLAHELIARDRDGARG